MALAGERIRSRRAELGLTLAQVAEMSGLSAPYVSSLERGHSNPTVSALDAVAGALGQSVADLFGGSGHQPPARTGGAPAGSSSDVDAGSQECSAPGPMAAPLGPVVGEWMRITRDELRVWADSEGAALTLPELMRKLIRETAPGARVDFPSGTGVWSGDWDGLVDCPTAHPYVPMGRSGVGRCRQERTRIARLSMTTRSAARRSRKGSVAVWPMWL